LFKKGNKDEISRIEKPITENFNYDILEAIESRKQSQIDYLNSKINDIYTKLEVIESQLIGSQSSKDSEDIQEFEIEENKEESFLNHNTSQDITLSKLSYDKYHKQITTIQFILNLLTEPKTSREIKNAIGKTREQTDRLMKKFYEKKLVERDIKNKPFRYKLTETGKNYLHQNKEDVNNNQLDSFSNM
jgi:DNA-binding MarR family transcriptional regulator